MLLGHGWEVTLFYAGGRPRAVHQEPGYRVRFALLHFDHAMGIDFPLQLDVATFALEARA